MTWDQIELFADAASERVRRDVLERANMAALGAAVGFSGDATPLKKIARALDLDGRSGLPEMPESATGSNDLYEAVRGLASDGQVRIKSHGSNSRRAGHTDQRVNKRVPRRNP